MTTKSGEGIELPALVIDLNRDIPQSQVWKELLEIREQQMREVLASNAELRGEASIADKIINDLKASVRMNMENASELEDCKTELQTELVGLRGELERLKADLHAMIEDRNLWQDAHNEDCPNLTRIAEVQAENSRLFESSQDIIDGLESKLSSLHSSESAENAWERGFEEGFYLGREYGMNDNADATFMIPEYAPPKPIEREG